MATVTRSIREVLLETIRTAEANRQGGNLQQQSILETAARSLVGVYGDPALEEAVLTQWTELFRTGLLAWGHNISNPNPPFFHLTERGRQALANVTRDPSNPDGYLRHLQEIWDKGQRGARMLPLNTIAESYIVEALECYVAGLFKAAAVMVGCAAEALILQVRDMVVIEVLEKAMKPVPSELRAWQVKTVTDGLTQLFQRIDKKTHRPLRDKFDAHWGGLTYEIRTTRNDAGHPSSIDPVTPESVHASLLLFPILTTLCADLIVWSIEEL